MIKTKENQTNNSPRDAAIDLRQNIRNLADLKQVMSAIIPGVKFELDNYNQVILYTGLTAEAKTDESQGELYFQSLIDEGFSKDFSKYRCDNQ